MGGRLCGMSVTSRRLRFSPIFVTAYSTAVWLLSGCLASGTEPAAVSPLEGQWDVSGQSAAAVATAIQGGMVVRSGVGTGFTGAYDVIETGAQGGQRRLSGPMSGRIIGTSSVEFDVTNGGSTRRHVATKNADTLRGNWFDLSSGGTIEASGTFRAVRR